MQKNPVEVGIRVALRKYQTLIDKERDYIFDKVLYTM